jgi:hypothetical protein
MFWLVILAACCVGLYLRFSGQSVDGVERAPVEHSVARQAHAHEATVHTADLPVHTVAQVSRHRNDIPTGTAIVARGDFVQVHFYDVSTGACSQLLYNDTVEPLNHGELDPRDYCRFAMVLQDEDKTWANFLVCNMNLRDAQTAVRKYEYGAVLTARGTYASSLVFESGMLLGSPMLDHCTLAVTPVQRAVEDTGMTPGKVYPANPIEAVER